MTTQKAERAATRTEREMFAMTAILDGDCLDRLAQMYDFGDFEGIPRDALEKALKSEAEEESGDWAAASAMAAEWLDATIDEFIPGAYPLR